MGSSSRPTLSLPAPGQNVKVWWIDSGCSDVDTPGKNPPGALKIGQTHGQVISLFSCDEIHQTWCSEEWCQCEVLELAMCSGGMGDTRSELAYLWVPAIVKVRVFR